MAEFGDFAFDVNNAGPAGNDTKTASRFFMDRDGTVNAMMIWLPDTNPGGHFTLGIYSDNSGLPGTLMGTSASTVWPNPGDPVGVSITCTLTRGYYWLAWLQDIHGTFLSGAAFRNTTGTQNRVANANTYALGFTPLYGVGTLDNDQWTMFANFTPTLTAGTYLGEITGGIGQDGGPNQYQANSVTLFQVTAPTPGHIPEINFYLAKAYPGAKMKALIYDATGVDLPVTDLPGNLLGTSNELVSPIITGNTVTFTPPVRLPTAGKYYIGLFTDTQMFDYDRSDVTARNYQATGTTYGSGPPDPFPLPSPGYPFFPTFWATFLPDAILFGRAQAQAKGRTFIPPPRPKPCQAFFPPGAVVWVTEGGICWNSDVSASGCVMGMTISTTSEDFELVSGEVIAQQYTLRT